MSSDIYGFFHFFNNLEELIDAEDSLLYYDDIAIGKYIILYDSIKTDNNKSLGKKGEITYAFTSIFSDKKIFKKILEAGILKKENCFEFDSIKDNEFDENDNIKNGKTFYDYEDFIEFIKKHSLDET